MSVNIHGKEYYTVVERMEKMNKKTPAVKGDEATRVFLTMESNLSFIPKIYYFCTLNINNIYVKSYTNPKGIELFNKLLPG